jgi:hypothetical protein
MLITIDATATHRSNRYIKMYPKVTRNGFAEIDRHPVERAIDMISMKSSFTIDNNKGYKELMGKIDFMLKKISK